MLMTRGYAAMAPGSSMEPFIFSRREVGPHDVLIQIRYCGICHSDLHQVRDEWDESVFPLVPGHEIVGTVTQVGSEVNAFHVGDSAGVGCFVDSCRTCHSCRSGLEQYCEVHCVYTYNSTEKDGRTRTYGGYSDRIVVNEQYVLRMPDQLSPERAAPLLCAGITTYSPLRHWGVGHGHKLGVVGLGGLGHMAIKFGATFGAEVTVFSHSEHKRADAIRLGAAHFAGTSNPKTFKELERRFDFIIDTVSAEHGYGRYLELLKTDGTMILVGAPDRPAQLGAFPLIMRRRRLVGSLIGGIRETQEMLDFCAKHDVASDVEVIPIQHVDQAYERMLKGDVRYRFVIDLNSLQ
jgi:uncharacterized zinc-type alcohol dehydrogenase-like protein